MTRVSFLASAAADAEAAEAWYRERDPDVAARFRARLDEAVAKVASAPERWSAPTAGARRVLFSEFPYALHYRRGADEVVIVAVAHQHRRPGYWRRRR